MTAKEEPNAVLNSTGSTSVPAVSQLTAGQSPNGHKPVAREEWRKLRLETTPAEQPGDRFAAVVEQAAASKREVDIVADLFTKFETVSLEEPDHPVLRLHYSHQTNASVVKQELAQYAVSLFITILITALFLMLSYSTESLSTMRYGVVRDMVANGKAGKAFLFGLGTSFAAVIVPTLLVILVAPEAIGSGMTEVISFLNGAVMLEGVHLSHVIIKYLGVVGIVVGGLFAGTDGPMAKMGADVSVMVIESIPKWRWFRRIFYGETFDLSYIDDNGDKASLLRESNSDRNPGIISNNILENGETPQASRASVMLAGSLLNFLQVKKVMLFATLGASVAIAVVFRSPIGGIMFAVEEATSFFELNFVIRLTFATVIGFIIVSFTFYDVEHHISIGNLVIKNPVGATLFPLYAQCPLELRLPNLLTYLVIGIVAGLVGQGLNRILSSIQKVRQKNLIDPTKSRRKQQPERVSSAVHPCHKEEQQKPYSKLLSGLIHFSTTVDPKNAMYRLFEVLLVAALTTAAVVFLPVAPLLNACTPLSTPLEHITNTRPMCNFGTSGIALSCENLRKCSEDLAENPLCAPEETVKDFVGYVGATYVRYCVGNGTDLKHWVESSVSIDSQIIGSDGENGNATALQERTGVPSSPSTNGTLPNSNVTADTFQFVFDLSSVELENVLIQDEEGTCYYQIRTLLWSSPERQLKMLLARGVYDIWDVKSLLVFLVIYVVFSCMTYYIALPTDLVVPNLIVGATAGRIIGILTNLVRPGAVDPGAFALIGMTSLWSGTSGLVLTTTIIGLETTGDFYYLPALIIVTFTASWISAFFGPSLYHTEMENNGAPYLPADPARLLRTITTEKIMHKKLVVLRQREAIRTIRQVLHDHPYTGFPVVEMLEVTIAPSCQKSGHAVVKEAIRPVGYVRRARLIELLEDKAHILQNTQKLVEIESISTSMPMTVRTTNTASKVYSLFRLLGLKRVFVVDHSGFLVGMVSRRDLIRPVLTEEAEEEQKREREGANFLDELKMMAREITVDLEEL